jgi:hypothetical protein
MHKSMKERFKNLTSDRIVKRSYLASLFLICLTFIYIVVIYRYLPSYLPIYNQLTWGVNRLAERAIVFLPLLFTTAILFLNIIFSQIIYEKMPLVVRMISITTFFISFITCIFIIRITLLVI